MLSHIASREAPTGAERSLVLLAAGLRGQGFEVTVGAPGPWALEPELHAAGVRVERAGCRLAWLTYPDRRSPFEAWARWARFAAPDPERRRLRAWLRAQAPDVVHVNCLPHLGGAAAARSVGAPVVWHLREIVPPGLRRRWLAARLARHATRIVAVSEAVGVWVREEGLGGRLVVVHNGVEPPASLPDPVAARRELGLPGDGYLVGLFGQLVPHKGGLEFVRAARRALVDEPGLRFVLAGAGPDTFLRRLRDEASDDAPRIHLLPPRPTANLLLAAADAVCLPTMTPDPFPRSVLEAMAARRPVVAFRGGGVAEMVRDGEQGFLLSPGDVDGLAARFVELAREPARGRVLGEAGRRRVEREFTLVRHVERMSEVLRGAGGMS